MAGRFFLRFCLLFCCGTCHRRDTAEKKKAPKLHRHRSEKRSFEKSRWDDTAGKSSRERQAPAPVCRSQSAAPVMQGRHITDPLPGGSQDIGGAFRSRVQRPGVRHRRVYAGCVRPCDGSDEAGKCGQNGAVHPVNLRRLTQ